MILETLTVSLYDKIKRGNFFFKQIMPSTTGKVSKKVAKGVKSKINKIIHEIPDVNEQELEALVFGGSRTEVLNTLQEAGNTIVQTPEVQVEFFIDTNGAAEEDEEPVDELPVWIDQDTEMQVDIQSSRRLRKLKTDFDEVSISATTYESRLRAQFEKMNPAPAWAQKDTEKPLELEMMQSTNALITKSSKALNPDKLDILRLKDANQKAYSKVFHYLIAGRCPVCAVSSYCSGAINSWFR